MGKGTTASYNGANEENYAGQRVKVQATSLFFFKTQNEPSAHLTGGQHSFRNVSIVHTPLVRLS